MKKIYQLFLLLVICVPSFFMGCKKNDQPEQSAFIGDYSGTFLNITGQKLPATVNLKTGYRYGTIIIGVKAGTDTDSPKYTINGAINGPNIFVNKNDLKKSIGIRYEYNGAGVVVRDTLYLDLYEAYSAGVVEDTNYPLDTTWTVDKTKARKWEFTGPRVK